MTATTLDEVAAALDAFAQIEPTIAGFASIFAPQYAAVFAPFGKILMGGVHAVDVVAKDSDEGKDFGTALNDVLNTITPGAPNAPALVAAPTPPASPTDKTQTAAAE